MTTLGIARALAPYRRRAILVIFLRSSFIAVVVALLIAELLTVRPTLVGTPMTLAIAITLAIGLAVSAAYAYATTPALRDVARRVDRAGQLNDLVVTAQERDRRDDEITVVVARAAIASLKHVPAAQAYPIQAPLHWRRWTALAAAVQVIAIGLAWRAPDARPMPPLATALSLPGSGAGPDAANPAAPAPAPATSDGSATTATSATTSRPVAVTGRDAVPRDASAGDAAASGAGAAGDAATPSVAGLSDRETATGRNRYRQAANRVSDAIARGRVPAALRGVVERYFTAIRPQGQ